MFEGALNKVFSKEQKGVGGRPPYSYLLMFKILILQRLFNISDDQAEYQINDCVSFIRFLGLSLGDRVPTRRRSGCSGTPW
jgi:transposase